MPSAPTEIGRQPPPPHSCFVRLGPLANCLGAEIVGAVMATFKLEGPGKPDTDCRCNQVQCSSFNVIITFNALKLRSSFTVQV